MHYNFICVKYLFVKIKDNNLYIIKIIMINWQISCLFSCPVRNKRQIDTLNAQIHDRSLSWIGTGTSMKSGGVKLLNKWCGNAGVFDISVKCQPLQIYLYWLINFVVCLWFFSVSVKRPKTLNRPSGWFQDNRNYSAILATLQITSYVHSRNSS